MGVIKFFSSDSYLKPCNCQKNCQEEKSLPNPDPSNWRIIRHEQIEEYLIIEIKYPDCKNYEGRKILLYNATLQELKEQKLIDPHFSENENFISPIARFEPTRWGMILARKLVKSLNKER